MNSTDENPDVEKQYVVIWKIDVFAKNRKEAAKQAREIQLDESSDATIFDVYLDDPRDTVTIDLSL